MDGAKVSQCKSVCKAGREGMVCVHVCGGGDMCGVYGGVWACVCGVCTCVYVCSVGTGKSLKFPPSPENLMSEVNETAESKNADRP